MLIFFAWVLTAILLILIGDYTGNGVINGIGAFMALMSCMFVV